MNAQHSSESVELYTPAPIVEPARELFVGFDVDPASTPEANALIGASRIFTKADNGYLRPWGEVGSGGIAFVNPPGGLCDVHGLCIVKRKVSKGVVVREACKVTGECGLEPGHVHRGPTSSQAAWWAKTCMELTAGRIAGAFFVGFSIELLQTAQVWDCAHPLDFPCVLPRERIPFDTIVDGQRVSGREPTHANVLVCVGARYEMVRAVFGHLGKVTKGESEWALLARRK